MTHTVTVGEHSVRCAPDQTILDAFLRNGVWIPNSCNQGSCGTCKVRVRDGEIDHRDSPLDTLTEDKRAAGYALACQATPRRDLVVEPHGTEEPGSTHVLRDLVATVTEVRDIARDTRRLLLTLDTPLEFTTGQYVEVTVPGTDIRRQYSLANTPDEGKVLELHIRRVPGGIASDGWAFGPVAVGDRIDITGPLGDFKLSATDDTSAMILIAGGTGLAPLKAIARAALRRNPARQVHLYHGVRTTADLYDLEFFRELESNHPGFRFIPVLSDEDAERTGFPTDAYLEDFETSRGHSGYLCGPPPMVDAGAKAFKRRRMSPRAINREKFTPTG